MRCLELGLMGVLLALSGCGSSDEPSGDAGDDDALTASGDAGGDGDGPGGVSGDPPTGSAGGSSSEATTDPQPPVKLDLGVIPDAGIIDEFGCSGIDFLFVVDNSGSMGDDQIRLLASFDGFITAIQDSIQNVSSYHVGVISSDAYNGNQPGCSSLGDLVTQTSGFDSSNMVCSPFAEGGRFATDADDLTVKFPCMAQIGTSGSPIEQPVTGAIAALDPAKAQAGGCNEGFVRDDAILVVVIVTDDPPANFDMDDAHPGTDTTGWFDGIVSAKNGDVEGVVVIGFVPWMDVSCTGNESPNLIGFIQSFGAQGVLASVCEPDFSPIFASTVETIKTTCNNFVPG